MPSSASARRRRRSRAQEAGRNLLGGRASNAVARPKAPPPVPTMFKVAFLFARAAMLVGSKNVRAAFLTIIRRLLRKIRRQLSAQQPPQPPKRGKIYNITIDAGDDEESYLKASHLIRGEIISKYASVEFMMADLYFRAIRLTEYSHLPIKLPYQVKRRINTLKKLALMNGPIERYRAEILGMSDRFLEFEDIRQFMAHGNMFARFGTSAPYLECFVYDQPKNSGPILKHTIFTLDQLARQSISLGVYTDDAVNLFYKMCTEIPLPPIGADPADWISHRVQARQ